MHPSMPVCLPSLLSRGLNTARYTRDRDFAAYLLATCAFMSLQAPTPYRSLDSAKLFLSEAVRLYNVESMGETPTIEIALACFMIFGSLWTLGSVNAAWMRLQETINWTNLLQLHRLDSTEPSQDLLWPNKVHFVLGLTVTERLVTSRNRLCCANCLGLLLLVASTVCSCLYLQLSYSKSFPPSRTS